MLVCLFFVFGCKVDFIKFYKKIVVENKGEVSVFMVFGEIYFNLKEK